MGHHLTRTTRNRRCRCPHLFFPNQKRQSALKQDRPCDLKFDIEAEVDTTTQALFPISLTYAIFGEKIPLAKRYLSRKSSIEILSVRSTTCRRLRGGEETATREERGSLFTFTNSQHGSSLQHHRRSPQQLSLHRLHKCKGILSVSTAFRGGN